VLHTIIFQRALGYVVPREVDSELADITYVSGATAAAAAATSAEAAAAAGHAPSGTLLPHAGMSVLQQQHVFVCGSAVCV
jgi:hypothetical protein